MPAKHPSSRRYPPEVKKRAVDLVLTTFAESGERHAVIARVAKRLDIGDATLRTWVRQAEIDAGARPGRSSAEHQRIIELERENRGSAPEMTRFIEERLGASRTVDREGAEAEVDELGRRVRQEHEPT